MFYKRNRKQSGRKPVARKGKVQVSKNVKRAVKQVLNKQVETKTINCPQAPGGSQNSNNTTYGALSGIQYMVQDVFRQPQGVSDGTTLGSANRIDDKIKGVGFL